MPLSTEKINKTILQSEPEAIIELFEIDLSLTGKNTGNLLFHPGQIDKFQSKSITWRDEKYIPLACELDGFDLTGDGRLPRPKMVMSNHQGIVSKYLKFFKELTGAKVSRRRTFLKYLDADNFPNSINPYGDPDPSARFQDDIFFINNKTSENKYSVEFELVSILELEQVFLPSRQIMSTYCNWIYRSEIGCQYKGKPIADKNNKKIELNLDGTPISDTEEEWVKGKMYPKGQWVTISPLFNKTSDDFIKDPRISPEHWVKDECSKQLAGCKFRFGNDDHLPFGGFPATDKFGFR